MKSLFNEFGMLTDNGREISKKFKEIADPFIVEFCNEYKGRDVSSLLCEEVDLMCSTERIKQSLKHHIKNKNKTSYRHHYNGEECLGVGCPYCDKEDSL